MHQTHPIAWKNGRVPVSLRFDDPFYSLENGLAEAHHVFLAGNRLPARFCPGFHIAELGFGTGLNLAAAWAVWCVAGVPGPLCSTSFEAFPLSGADARRALSMFPKAAVFAEPIAKALDGTGRIETETLNFTLIRGDARHTVPQWHGHADAWFLDGFAPTRNPALWDPALLRAVAAHTAPGGGFATYTAAGAVRRALAQAGFMVEKQRGYGRKRHMMVGRLP